MTLSAQRLDHWTLITRDIERTTRFYVDVLGAQPLERRGPAGVKFGGTTIDFFPADDKNVPSPGSDLQHHAYIIDYEDFDGWVEQLRAHQVSLRFANFGTRMSILFDDVEGYHFELTAPMESREAARRELTDRGLTIEPD